MAVLAEKGPIFTGMESVRNLPKEFIKSLTILTLTPLNSLERKIALLETVDGKKVSVFVHSDLPPSRVNKNFVDSYFKEHSHVGLLNFSNSPNSVDLNNEITSAHAKEMSEICKKTSIRKDERILVGGMAASVVPDQESPDSIHEKTVLKSIGFLFSKVGPFKNMAIISNIERKKEKMLVDGGAQLLLDGEGLSILTDKAIPFVERFLKKYQNLNIFPFFVAISAYLRKWLDVFDPQNLDGVGFGKTRKDFLKEMSEKYLKSLAESLSI